MFKVLFFTAQSILVLFSLTTVLSAAANNESSHLTWLTEDFPPLYIINGKLKNEGTSEKLLDMLSTEMPEYQYSRKLLPIKRIIVNLKEGRNVSCISFLRDETITDFAQYSDPVFVLPPHEVIMRKNFWKKYFNEASIISAKNLLRKKKILGISSGRNYGVFLNTMIEKHQKNKSSLLYERTGDHFVGLANMLLKRRIDLAFAYKGELNYFQSITPDGDQLVSISIEEVKNTPLYVYAVMPRTPWGDQLKKNINQALKRMYKKKGYVETLEQWFISPSQIEIALLLLKGFKLEQE